VASGYFDPIHKGHIEYLKLAKKLGGKLIVILNNDKQAQLKKGKPFMELEERKTKEAIIAKEADYLEVAFQAKEYMEQGYKDAQIWIDNVDKVLVTKSAKELMKQLKKTSYNDWWKGLKKVPKTIKE